MTTNDARSVTAPTPEQLQEIAEVTAELADAMPVLTDLGRRAYNAYKPFLGTLGHGLTVEEEEAAHEAWSAAEKLSDLAGEAMDQFAPAARTGDPAPAWYDRNTDPENVAMDATLAAVPDQVVEVEGAPGGQGLGA